MCPHLRDLVCATSIVCPRSRAFIILILFRLTISNQLLGRISFLEVPASCLSDGEDRMPVCDPLRSSGSTPGVPIRRIESALPDEIDIMMRSTMPVRCFGALLDSAERDSADRLLDCCIVGCFDSRWRSRGRPFVILVLK
jgi:hypothetical protein